MASVVPTVISHFKILEKLGEGGMGVVYKGEDISLRRPVALKFLPTTLLAGEEERKRFMREAQAAAALNHPTIATIFSIEEAANQVFIVLELVDGQSLDKKIASGPLKISEALNLAAQLCEGLATAHEKGIVHRDIKSANVMVTARGQVKILDFGLAKLKGASRITREGAVVGTTGYMSPEQLRGETTDQRTDVWSTGVLLYEMVSGRLPFNGEFEQAVTYQVLNEQPEPLTAVRTGVPVELERIVQKSIAKNADERYQHMVEMLVDLRRLAKSTGESAPISPSNAPGQATRGTGRLPVLLPWVIAGVMTVAAAFLFWSSTRESMPVSPSYRFRVTVESGESLSVLRSGRTIGNVSLAVSRDGRSCVYVSRDPGGVRLNYRDLSTLESTPLPGSENAEMPFFSPDGQWIGFASGGMLRRISLKGGSPYDICSVSDFGGADWGIDDTVTFSDRENGCLWRVHVSGGSPVQVTFKQRHFENETEHLWPQSLGESRAILFTGSGYNDDGKVSVISLATGKRRTLIDGGLMARYIPTGHIIYVRREDGAIYAVPFDIRTLEVGKQPVQVLSGVALCDDSPQFAVSGTGVLVYAPGVANGSGVRFVWVDRSGGESPLPLDPGYYIDPHISPDGRWLLYSSGEKQSDLWLLNLLDGTSRPFANDKGDKWWAAWTPDGKSIVYNMAIHDDPTGAVDMYRKPVNGGTAERLTTTNLYQQPCCFTSDGKWLIFQRTPQDGRLDIFAMTLDTPRVERPLVQTPADDHLAALSPDNRWLAYTSDETGRSEVYARPYGADGDAVRVSRNGGIGPVWAPDGRQLYFRDHFRGEKVFTALIRKGGGLQFEEPKLLFEGSYVSDIRWGRNFDIAPDGRRFIMLKANAPPPLRQFIVVTNWFDEMNRKLRRAG